MKEERGNFAKCVMNVEVVPLEVSKYSITTLINVSFCFNSQQSETHGVQMMFHLGSMLIKQSPTRIARKTNRGKGF